LLALEVPFIFGRDFFLYYHLFKINFLLVSGEIIFGYWIDCLVIGKNKNHRVTENMELHRALRDPLRR